MEHDYNRPTPPWLMEIFKDWFDPCPLNPDWKTNGLELVWPERTYCNPPYKNIKDWTDKALGSPYMTAMLLPSDTSTLWFADLLHSPRAHIFWYQGRRIYKTNRGMMLVIIENDGLP